MKAKLLENLFDKMAKMDTANSKPVIQANNDHEVLAELKALYPTIISFGTSKVIINKLDSLKADSVEIAIIKFKTRIRDSDKIKLERWLRTRYQKKSLRLLVE